ncbi:hypothetical protein [Streptomyces sp. NPDC047706]|uniref:hypothetical protein n=1 Tax=Streptomyces sp. NPDC047706 TaxID=3365486 RepID=UPI00372032C4
MDSTLETHNAYTEESAVSLAFTDLTSVLTGIFDAPWWVSVPCLGAAAGLSALRTVFPQNSADRLAWWRDRRRHQERRTRDDAQ